MAVSNTFSTIAPTKYAMTKMKKHGTNGFRTAVLLVSSAYRDAWVNTAYPINADTAATKIRPRNRTPVDTRVKAPMRARLRVMRPQARWAEEQKPSPVKATWT